MKKILLFVLISCISISCAKTKNQAKWVSLSQRSDIQLEIDPQLSTPTLIKGDLASLHSFHSGNTVRSALKILELNQDIFKLRKPDKELVLEHSEKDDLGFEHLTFMRQVANIKIWGDELKMHFNKDGMLYHVNGRYHASLPENFSTKPKLDQVEAEQLALTDAGEHVKANRVKTSQLIIFPKDQMFYLAYRVNVVGGALDAINWDYFVDAVDGSIIYKMNNIRASN